MKYKATAKVKAHLTKGQTICVRKDKETHALHINVNSLLIAHMYEGCSIYFWHINENANIYHQN